MDDGATRIATERRRQVEAEGYDTGHDDAHDRGELLMAAMVYIGTARYSQALGRAMPPKQADLDFGWPWEPESLKPSDDPIRDLERAGALIAAEIDRLLRLKGETE